MAKILIIEDNDGVRKLLRRTLEQDGYQIEEAADGQSALKTFKKAPADVVITDIFMPKKNGFETITELRKESAGVKIIAISGGGLIESESFLEMSKKLGAIFTLKKPFLPKDVQRLVRQLAGPNGNREENLKQTN